MRSTRKKRKKGGRKKNCRYLQGGAQSPRTARVVNPTIKTLTKAEEMGQCWDYAKSRNALPSRRTYEKAGEKAQEKYASCLHNDVEKGGCGGSPLQMCHKHINFPAEREKDITCWHKCLDWLEVPIATQVPSQNDDEVLPFASPASRRDRAAARGSHAPKRKKSRRKPRRKSHRPRRRKSRRPRRQRRRKKSRKRPRASGRKTRYLLSTLGLSESESAQRQRLLKAKQRKEGAERMDIVTEARKILQTKKRNLARLERKTRSVPQMRETSKSRRRGRRHQRRHTRELRQKLRKGIREEEKHLERMTSKAIYTPTDYSPAKEIDAERVLVEVQEAVRKGGPEYSANLARVDDIFLKE